MERYSLNLMTAPFFRRVSWESAFELNRRRIAHLIYHDNPYNITVCIVRQYRATALHLQLAAV